MNNYEKVYNYVFHRLKTKSMESNGLNEDDIRNEIISTRKLLDLDEPIKKMIFDSDIINLSDVELQRIKRELEAHFNVKMNEGILIQGDEQQDRDTSWWSSVEKQKTTKYYWSRYELYLKTIFPKEVVKVINDDTDIVMNNLEKPSKSNFNRYGMVVGHVQSGKTANYSALVCKAADVGYKFIVVIAGGINNLRNQTQVRLNESFIGEDKGRQIGAGIGDYKPEKLPISLTTVERDFNKQDADRISHSINFDNINTPVLLVIKKNTHTLSNVISWLQSQYKNGVSSHAMLLIDDESDYASINTKDAEDPTTINKKLRKLLNIFQKSCYVAYTATPYANIFIDHEAGHEDVGRDLFPKDFIYSLDAPSNYFGARKVFKESKKEHLVPIDDYLEDIPPYHKKDFDLPAIPESLEDAMLMFILNIAIRHLRGHESKHNSMLIHATRFTAVHNKLALHAEEFIEKYRVEINSFGMLANPSAQSTLIKKLHDIYIERDNIKDKPPWKDVISVLCKIINTIVIREVHQKTKISLEYRRDEPTNVIVVGGASLSRGYTLEGLNISYFLRNTIFYDTLMQMGRWFGFRIEYEDLCKVYLSESMIDNFGNIIEATEDLIKDFKIMSDAKKTPNDFGLAVKQHPESALQVTARNKQKNVSTFILDMRLAGQLKETGWLSDNPEDIRCNNLLLKHTVNQLNKRYKHETINRRHSLWRNVDKKEVLEFIEKFKFYSQDYLGITARMPIAFIKEYVKTRNLMWDVAFYGGRGTEENFSGINHKREQRIIVHKNGYLEVQNRQVSSGTSEAITLSKEQRKNMESKRKETRACLEKPILMLHPLENEEYSDGLAAFGVSFPGSVLSKEETINLKVNTVMYKQILKDLEAESDD
jgi:hypothetical protein